jgi:hypothetical protein
MALPIGIMKSLGDYISLVAVRTLNNVLLSSPLTKLFDADVELMMPSDNVRGPFLRSFLFATNIATGRGEETELTIFSI